MLQNRAEDAVRERDRNRRRDALLAKHRTLEAVRSVSPPGLRAADSLSTIAAPSADATALFITIVTMPTPPPNCHGSRKDIEAAAAYENLLRDIVKNHVPRISCPAKGGCRKDPSARGNIVFSLSQGVFRIRCAKTNGKGGCGATADGYRVSEILADMMEAEWSELRTAPLAELPITNEAAVAVENAAHLHEACKRKKLLSPFLGIR